MRGHWTLCHDPPVSRFGARLGDCLYRTWRRDSFYRQLHGSVGWHLPEHSAAADRIDRRCPSAAHLFRALAAIRQRVSDRCNAGGQHTNGERSVLTDPDWRRDDVETGHYRGRPLIQVWMSASRRIGNATPGKTVNRQGEDVPLFSLAVYCKKFVSESVKFSAGLGERKSLIDQYIELRVDAVQRLPKRKR